jgi:hypothetical protein
MVEWLNGSLVGLSAEFLSKHNLKARPEQFDR